MNRPQPAILADLPPQCRYLTFNLRPDADPKQLRHTLEALNIDDQLVVGLGLSLIKTLDLTVPPLHPFPIIDSRIDMPSTPTALWCWLRGSDRGELLHRSRKLQELLQQDLSLESCIEGFRYREGRDLTGYEDGTENPTGDDAASTALVDDGSLKHSSFVAVQQWTHQMERFEELSQQQQDHAIGRRLSDNEELDDAPDSAHVKRTAQESFAPEAFVLRRSMPWSDGLNGGLVFVSFGHSFDAFEQLLKRMCGVDDGVEDALFAFTQPRTGAYFWCPALEGEHLALNAAARK